MCSSRLCWLPSAWLPSEPEICSRLAGMQMDDRRIVVMYKPLGSILLAAASPSTGTPCTDLRDPRPPGAYLARASVGLTAARSTARAESNATLIGRIVGSLWDDRFGRLCKNGTSTIAFSRSPSHLHYVTETFGEASDGRLGTGRQDNSVGGQVRKLQDLKC